MPLNGCVPKVGLNVGVALLYCGENEKRGKTMIEEIRFDNEVWVLDGWDVDKEGKISKIYFKVKQVGA